MVWLGVGGAAIDVIYDHQDAKPRYEVGGSTANVAMILAHFEKKVRYNTAVGIDLEGSHVLAYMKNLNIDVIADKIEKTPRFLQRIGFIENEEIKYGNYYLNCRHGKRLPKLMQPSQSYVGLSDVNMFYFQELTTHTLALAKKCHKFGIHVWFEPQLLEEKHQDVLQYCNVVKYGKETEIVTDVEMEIKTMGSKGLEYRIHDGAWNHVSALAAPNAVADEGGAGDHLTAGMVLGMLDGLASEDSISYGMALASLSTCYKGARGLESNATFDEINSMTQNVVDGNNIDNLPIRPVSSMVFEPCECK